MKPMMLIPATFLALSVLAMGATIKVPDDYTTIQRGIYAAENGDTVLVAPGTYFENIIFPRYPIIVKSTQGSACTVIDGCKSGSVVSFINCGAVDSLLQGFTITNGSGTKNNNMPFCYGGGIFCIFSSPTIQGNIISKNTVSSTGFGGAIACVEDSSPYIVDNIILDNYSDSSGGGIFVDSLADPLIENCSVIGNIAEKNGGGLSCRGKVGGHVRNCIIQYNRVLAETDGNGGGINIHGNTLIEGSLIEGNEAADAGGGIYCFGFSPAVRSCTFRENKSYGHLMMGGGGGVQCDYSELTLSCCNFIGNSAIHGGGLYMFGYHPVVVNCAFVQNSAGTIGGGGIYDDSYGATITNCTIVENTGRGLSVPYGTNSHFTNCILWSNEPTQCYGYGPISIAFSDIQDGWIGEGNIDADPLFADPSTADFHVTDRKSVV